MRRKKVAQGVTTVRRSPKEDRDRRIRSYAIAMSIRTVSFPLAVWALLSGWMIIGILLALAATFLPQVAVMMANAVDHRTAPAGTLTSPTRMLGPAESSTSRGPTTSRDATGSRDATTSQDDHDAEL